ncbi:benzoylformate decarboxylase [Amycolatopsis bartoniae]|uniref:Benzoylformate decarboxylase n=1 Tax=Amycolatopsis bartoniae TaxID=941986 RepID=A0A8H9M9P6_9PSEU|nr:benzoylformate decarboxylase [Amycolatopsis bartoniae]MBB2934982.1 benzoylformate decarboxylase [Amycolatopsis bartoniae]TVT01977.1 benzoylformate decarboxylase [Amycolatopsis bartoniae]GHF43330.1 benzoylformate decarboxylase [Amycolatopsis bartoniae]
MAEQTVRDVVRNLMREWEITTVFGNPGTTEVPFLADWPDDFRYVLGLHETAVLAMADAYAQFTERPAIVSLHSAGGLGHALGSLVTAYQNRAPLIVIAGQQERSMLPYDPFLSAVDAAQFPKPWVKWSLEPTEAAAVPAAFARAYQVATQPPYGPVFLSIPADDWLQPAEPLPAMPRVRGYGPDPDAIAEVAAALNAASRPALVLGAAVDIDNAVPDAIALAEATRAAVYTAPFAARSPFPEDHPQFAGHLKPAKRKVHEALAAYDLVVVIGAPAFTYHVPSKGEMPALPPLFLLNDDPQVLARTPHATAVMATPRAAIRSLTARVETPETREAPAPRQRRAKPAEPAAGELMTAAYVYDALTGILPSGVLVVEEAPSLRPDIQEHLPITARGGGFLTMASGVLGYGLPAAVGAKMAQPGRPVVAVLGDGSSMYGIQALWTAAQEHVAAVFVILDNREYGAVREHAESSVGGKVPGQDLGGLDFCGLARSMGCDAVLVERPDELEPAVTGALASGAPTLVHVRIQSGAQ